jgi:hypothetical protein
VATVDPIKVRGLRDFQAALKAMDGESQKQLRIVLNTVSESVAAGARRRVPRKTGKAAASIKVASSQREARIKAGGAKAGYYPWLDYGGKLPQGGRRPFVPQGRHLYPTYHAQKDSIGPALEKALTDLARSAGLEVT